MTQPVPSKQGLAAADWIALILTVIWLGGVLAFSLLGPGIFGVDGAAWSFAGLAVVVPVALVWMLAQLVKTAAVIRRDSQELQHMLEGLKQAYLAQSTPAPTDTRIAEKLDEIAAATRNTETALAMFSTSRRESAEHLNPMPGFAEDQPTLALDLAALADEASLSNEDFIRALHFPENENDSAGFAALRRALQDHHTAQLITAAQDILTLLSEEGVYTDDLRPDRARPEVWRNFAQGARGKEVAALGGVRDRSSLAIASGRMKQDPIFRDTAHHFLRRFDKAFSAFEPNATDSEISAAADTRSARAFMLLGRVAGTFD
jgi:hypothetical protein